MLSAPAAIRASESVKSQILSGALPGGELLSEGEVAQELGVSRTPVHEAFRRLEAEELLRLIPPGGAVVVPVSPREAVEVIELRRALETAAVRRLALAEYTAARVALAERLTALIGEQEQHAATGDVTGFAVVDEAFHRAIVTASENRLCGSVLRDPRGPPAPDVDRRHRRATRLSACAAGRASPAGRAGCRRRSGVLRCRSGGAPGYQPMTNMAAATSSHARRAGIAATAASGSRSTCSWAPTFSVSSPACFSSPDCLTVTAGVRS